jgi:hypothetical protein
MESRSRRKGQLGALVVAIVLALPSVAVAAYPGSDPGESPRANAPNDPDFDRCEADDAETPERECFSYAEEEFRAFGFSPDSANSVPGVPHEIGATRYLNCDQLDAQGRAANVAAGDPECAQIAGVRADTAWKYSTGDPDTTIAILDTGIRWQSRELVEKIRLNRAELPLPRDPSGDCTAYDCNGDGAFNVADYADDPRVGEAAGDQESDSLLDGSDLIAAFSDGTDADGNGYVDDIAGWDFFDDDNDPFDASSCCSASGHGTGRAAEAAAQTNNAADGVGMCPDCQIMPLRVWDTFVVPTDNFAMGLVYAADNGASVAEGAVGGLTNTQFARSAFGYADERGLALTMVSSDINSANHNYPTNYNEAIYVAGSIYDTAPNETCEGPGGLPGVGDLPVGPGDFPGFGEGCAALLDALEGIGVEPGDAGQPVTTSFFRNSNLTQYGGKADIVMMGSTGSENTGQASGAAALLMSYGREVLDSPLSGNEVRQLLTMTAEDVLPENTGSIGLPDKASPGWDPHFGYGRVNLAGAMARIESGEIPPEAQLDAPDWFAPINVDRVPDGGVAVRGRAAAPHSDAGVGDWRVEYACGQDALDTVFQPIPGLSGSGPQDGVLGTIPKAIVTDLAAGCDGSVAADAGRPGGTAADAWPADPYPSPDPERHAFQIRLTVEEAGNPGNFGRYRKTLFAYENDGNLGGWPKAVGEGSVDDELITGSGGEAPPRLYDLDGDNALDVLLPTSSGELYALDSAGDPLNSFNGGEPVRTRQAALAAAGRLPTGLEAPRESLRAPVIGDIDGDRDQEIVATAGEHVYAWHTDGSEVAGFPARIDPSLSEPCLAGAPEPCFDTAQRAINGNNHIKRGFAGSPALADLVPEPEGEPRRLEIVAGSLDQHLYAFDGDGGRVWDPVKLDSEDAPGAEIVTSPAIAQLDGDPADEVVIATNEVIGGDPPSSFPDPRELMNLLLTSATGSNPVYGVDDDGSQVEGWPVRVGVAAGDLLPFVLPGHDAAIVDTDDDGVDEISVSAATSVNGLGGTRLVGADGSTLANYVNGPTNGVDQGPILNLADYSSIGDVVGAGYPQVFKAGLTVNGAANLLAVNQNLPFNHVVQGWSLGPSGTGESVPGFPRATDDFQLVSQPSIARVGGTGTERQVLVGTGLYQLHAYGPGGVEPEGWPKFTGGWTQATPSVGDADGDGTLEVAALTREGWSFLWETGTEACDGSNDEWWTFHHDEFGSANYGTDARPPGTAEGLGLAEDGALTWTAPGDDWLCGEAAGFEVRASADPIDAPGDGEVVRESEGAPAAAGEEQTVTLSAGDLGDARHLAVVYRDDAGNWGGAATVEVPADVDPDPEPDPDPAPGPDPADPTDPADPAPGGGDGTGGPGGELENPGNPAPGPCANRVEGSFRNDRLVGTGGPDRLRGFRGNDVIKARGGDDCVDGGKGRDRIRCGAGEDVAIVDKRDEVKGCERTRRK